MVQSLSHADFKVIIKLLTEKMEAFSDPLLPFFPLFTNKMRTATMKKLFRVYDCHELRKEKILPHACTDIHHLKY